MKNMKINIQSNIFFMYLFIPLASMCGSDEEEDLSGNFIIEITNETNAETTFNIVMDNYSMGSITAKENITVTGDNCLNIEDAGTAENVRVIDQVFVGSHTLTLVDDETNLDFLTTEFEMPANGCLVLPIVLGLPTGINLDGIWILDLTLANTGQCDETLLEDEANIPPTFHFNTNGTLTFDTDPVDSDLNGPYFTNTYNLTQNILKIRSHYNDENESILFDATLTYSNDKFIGTYTNDWGGGVICTNDIVISRQ